MTTRNVHSKNPSPSRELPSKPSLTQLRHQAKDLLKVHKKRGPEVCVTLRRIKRLKGLSDEQIFDVPVSLQEAQHALAADYGFADWTALKYFVEVGFWEVAMTTQISQVDWGKELKVVPLTDDMIPKIGKFFLRVNASLRDECRDGTQEGAEFYVRRYIENGEKRGVTAGTLWREVSAVVVNTHTDQVVAVCMVGGPSKEWGFHAYDYFVDPAYDYDNMMKKMLLHASTVIAEHREEILASGCKDVLGLWREDDDADTKLFEEIGFKLTGKADGPNEAKADDRNKPLILEGLTSKPRWITHLGSIGGCLDHLGIDISDAWLFGGTGHAFFLNICRDLCPSAFTAWRTERFFALMKNMGFTVDRVLGHKSDDNFTQVQERGRQKIGNAIHAGYPSYGWDMKIPEYYVINGFDESGSLTSNDHDGTAVCISGPDAEQEWVKWKDTGGVGTGVFEIGVVRPCDPKDDIVVAREALESALDMTDHAEQWAANEAYKVGVQGYDLWISAISEGTASGFGMALAASSWGQCRHFAKEFLSEASRRLSGKCESGFKEAIEHYTTVATRLSAICELFPFLGVSQEEKDRNMADPDRCQQAVLALTAAREAETRGLAAIRRIVREIDDIPQKHERSATSTHQSKGFA
jgi:hypothetical protein